MAKLTMGSLMTEDMPHNAHTRKGKTRSEMSKAAFEAHKAGKLKVTAARGSEFFLVRGGCQLRANGLIRCFTR